MFNKTQRTTNHRRITSGICLGLFIASVTTAANSSAPTPQPVESVQPAQPLSAARVIQNYGTLPLSFEANQGQADKQVRFLAHGNGYGLFLTGSEAVLALRKSTRNANPLYHRLLSSHGVAPGPGAPPPPGGLESGTNATPDPVQPSSKVDVLRMQLAGANPESNPVGEEIMPGTTNYFRGNDPAQWHSAIANFQKVRYPGVYPGVDLVYYGRQRQLEYDFVVAPGADPRPIQLHFAGATSLKLEHSGSLTIAAEDGSIAFQQPQVYQTVNGSRHAITGAFRLLADNSVGFTLGHYDHSKPLIIDPILAYSTYFGGSSAEFVVAVTADSSGNAFVTGLTISEDFPLTAGAFQAVDFATPSNAVSTAFISKFNPSGTALLYSTYLGGIAIPNTLHAQGDYGKAIAVDSAGNAYITGYTYSSDFPITSGAFQKGNQAASIALATGFVTKLNPSGTGLVYSTYLGGNTLDELSGIAIDAAGDAFISGISFSSNYPTTAGVLQTVNNSFAQNGYNSVITKLNPTGSALIYSTYLGGAQSSGSALGSIYWTNPIVVDKSGNAYVAGFTSSGNFPVTPGAFQTSASGPLAVTVSKLNPTATALLYSTYLGGSLSGSFGAICEGLAVDSAGNAYVAGYTDETDFPVTTGAFQTVNKAGRNTTYSIFSNENGFLTKINPTGKALVYSTYLGGTTGPWGGDQIYGLALDTSGNAYLAGSAMSADFPVTANAFQPKNHGATHCCDYTAYASNAFLTEVNPTATALVYSTYLGGAGTQNPLGPGASGDSAYDIALGPHGSAFIVGFTSSANFPVSAGAFKTKYKTQQNTGFLAAFDLGTAPTTLDTVTTLTASANPVNPGTKITFTAVVAPASGTGVPTGKITIAIDEVTVAVLTPSSQGVVSYSTASLPAGEHYILASYSGSSSFATSGDGLNEFVAPLIPVISPPAGTYTSQQTVTISNPTPGAALYFTLDGSIPSRFGTAYTGPITVNYARTIKAVAVSANSADSVQASSAYNIIGSPLVLAAPANALNATNATLNAFVNTLGLAGSCVFQYGTSATALTVSTPASALAAANTRVAATANLTTLKSKTTYYFRVVVTTPGGITTGPVLSFATN